ncbi:MAG: hypothetical protein IK126_02665 [Bacteroidales bacterium]|nr:hypothetical protein [Bacteroidales bacterium]
MSKKSKQQLEEELKVTIAKNKRLKETIELEKLLSRGYDTILQARL